MTFPYISQTGYQCFPACFCHPTVENVVPSNSADSHFEFSWPMLQTGPDSHEKQSKDDAIKYHLLHKMKGESEGESVLDLVSFVMGTSIVGPLYTIKEKEVFMVSGRVIAIFPLLFFVKLDFALLHLSRDHKTSM